MFDTIECTEIVQNLLGNMITDGETRVYVYDPINYPTLISNFHNENPRTDSCRKTTQQVSIREKCCWFTYITLALCSTNVLLKVKTLTSIPVYTY
jgi:hypothetical protein